MAAIEKCIFYCSKTLKIKKQNKTKQKGTLMRGLDVYVVVKFCRVGAKIWTEMPASLRELPKNTS